MNRQMEKYTGGKSAKDAGGSQLIWRRSWSDTHMSRCNCNAAVSIVKPNCFKIFTFHIIRQLVSSKATVLDIAGMGAG